jgi:phage baseplate assembly protein V
MIEQIRREIKRGLASVRGAMRAVLQGISIAQRIQRVNAEGLADESLQDVELMQQFGFTSAPPAGSQIIVLPLGGRTSASVIIASEHGAYRLQLNNQGEAALYNQWGDHLWFKKGGVAELVATTKVDITSPLVATSGDLSVGGNITCAHDITATGNVSDQGGAKSMAGMRGSYNGHGHTDPQGGTVGPAAPAM